jgi:hypothetical protein
MYDSSSLSRAMERVKKASQRQKFLYTHNVEFIGLNSISDFQFQVFFSYFFILMTAAKSSSHVPILCLKRGKNESNISRFGSCT